MKRLDMAWWLAAAVAVAACGSRTPLPGLRDDPPVVPVEDAQVKCIEAATSVEAHSRPVEMYFMVDRSGSMAMFHKWDDQTGALEAFFLDPGSEGLTVALQFFPKNDLCNAFDETCSGAEYVDPLVPWGALTSHATQLLDAVYATAPDGCHTPTQEALQGALTGALDRQLTRPDHVVAAVLVSDGAPCCDSCPIETSAELGQIAGGYFKGTPSIRTFAVFVDEAANSVMWNIAWEGGTKQAYDATGGTSSFLQALQAIQGAAIDCAFPFPEVDGGIVDPEEVSVIYTNGGSGEERLFERLDGLDACSHDNEWTFDAPDAPTQIVLCPRTCDAVREDLNPKIEFDLGCVREAGD